MEAKPFLQWVGGKTRLMPQLLPYLPASIERHFELFTGGGGFFFATAPARAVLSDLNEPLMRTYQAVRDDVTGVIRLLHDFADQHNKLGEAFYRQVRARFNSGNTHGTAAAFIYLNRTCFNGVWRVNKSGKFNVPFGHDVSFTVDEVTLRAASAALQGTRILCGDFAAVSEQAERGDFVYLDPPYDATFTSYTAEGFDSFDLVRLRTVFDALNARGCKVLLSNSDSPSVRRAFEGYHVAQVECPRTIQPKAKKLVANEAVVWNYDDTRATTEAVCA